MTTAADAYDQQVPNQHQAKQPEDIDVAVLYPGGREEKLLRPLNASSLNITVEPDRPQDYDVIMLDQPRYKLAHAVLKYRTTPVVYRFRGNIWKEMDIWRFGRSKKFVAEHFLYPQLDAVIAVDDRLGDIFTAKTGVKSYSAGLAKESDQWPDRQHQGSELTLITLTNMNYTQKIGPLKTYIPVINRFLKANGGHWHICGEGINEEQVAQWTQPYEHVSFDGFVDPRNYLPFADGLIHVSEFDAYPNAILEGFASDLPVLTNAFEAFERDHAPNIVCDGPYHMQQQLKRLENPEERELEAAKGRTYLRNYHTETYVGEQYEHAFFDIVNTYDG